MPSILFDTCGIFCLPYDIVNMICFHPFCPKRPSKSTLISLVLYRSACWFFLFARARKKPRWDTTAIIKDRNVRPIDFAHVQIVCIGARIYNDTRADIRSCIRTFSKRKCIGGRIIHTPAYHGIIDGFLHSSVISKTMPIQNGIYTVKIELRINR
nr:MAG TPA: hypothetical protein [Caudoviricetes sp.]